MTYALYPMFRAARAALPADGRAMPYGWVELPKTLGANWMAYGLMADEFARELANTLNALTRYVRDLQASAGVVDPLTDRQKLEATISFIAPVATVALNLPAVIKARFGFAAAHLCHQANQLKASDWRDDLPFDSEIWPHTAEAFGKPWRNWRGLKRRLDAINSKRFQAATHDFRNTYNHRFSPRFVIGETQPVQRRASSDGRVSYAIGGQPALDLAVIAGLLGEERDRCYAAYEAFQALVREHAGGIAARPGV